MALEEYMYDALGGNQNNQFTEATIDFEIESLNMKMNYLRSLLKDSRDNKKPETSDFSVYFKDLKERFDKEGNLIG